MACSRQISIEKYATDELNIAVGMSTSNSHWSASGAARCAYTPYPAPGPRPPVGKVSPGGLGRGIRATSSSCEGSRAAVADGPEPGSRRAYDSERTTEGNGRTTMERTSSGYPVHNPGPDARSAVIHTRLDDRSVMGLHRPGARPLRAQRE